MITRRGFLKSLLAAPVVVVAPGLLHVPLAQPILAEPEVLDAMKPVIDATGTGATLFGYVARERDWANDFYREILRWDATHYFPKGADVIVIPSGTLRDVGQVREFARFAWHGTGLPIDGGRVVQIAQHWKVGEEIEPQLWLA